MSERKEQCSILNTGTIRKQRFRWYSDFIIKFLLAVIALSAGIAIFCFAKKAVNTIDYVHTSGPVISILAPMADNYKAEYAYYYTAPEYFDSLVWESSPRQADISRANDDGTLGEAGLRWYIAHSDSGYGLKIATLNKGQHITIDGVEYIIDDRGLTYAGAPTVEVREMTGHADLMLITCVEGDYPVQGHPEHVVWGHAVNPEQLTQSKRWS